MIKINKMDCFQYSTIKSYEVDILEKILIDTHNICFEPCHEKKPVVVLAHLSQRLIGELIVYPCSGVRPSSVRRLQCSNIFSETTWPIKGKLYVGPLWVGGTKVCSRHLGHMT